MCGWMLAAEPQGEGRCERLTLVSVHHTCTPPCVNCKYDQFCHHTVTFSNKWQKNCGAKADSAALGVFCCPPVQAGEPPFLQMSLIQFLTYCTTQLTEIWFNGPFQGTWGYSNSVTCVVRYRIPHEIHLSLPWDLGPSSGFPNWVYKTCQHGSEAWVFLSAGHVHCVEYKHTLSDQTLERLLHLCLCDSIWSNVDRTLCPGPELHFPGIVSQ